MNGKSGPIRLGELTSPSACRKGVIKARTPAKEAPVKGSLFDGLNPAQFAVCNLHLRQRPQGYDIKISFENPDALKEVERYTILSAIDSCGRSTFMRWTACATGIGFARAWPAGSAHRV